MRLFNIKGTPSLSFLSLAYFTGTSNAGFREFIMIQKFPENLPLNLVEKSLKIRASGVDFFSQIDCNVIKTIIFLIYLSSKLKDLSWELTRRSRVCDDYHDRHILYHFWSRLIYKGKFFIDIKMFSPSS